MTRRRISNRTPRELTAKERSALSDVVLELDSDFRVKTGSVDNISLETPVPGVFVLNEHDGLMYYADNYGWHQIGGWYNPINMVVEYTDTQFNFKFKAPATSTLTIVDGDGTVTEVAGNDATIVIHTTNYSEAGTYSFYVEGDYVDLTYVAINNQKFVSGDISGWCMLTSVEKIYIWGTNMYGDISVLHTLPFLLVLQVSDSPVHGDVSVFAVTTSLYSFTFHTTPNLTGDTAPLGSLQVFIVNCYNSPTTFDTVVPWVYSAIIIDIYDHNWTSEMTDNALKSFVGCVGCTINIGGNNAARTSASDAAFAIVDANNTLTVNE